MAGARDGTLGAARRDRARQLAAGDICARRPRGDDSSGSPAAIEIAGRAAIGAGLLRIDGELFKQITVITHLRASAIFGNVVIVRGSDELKAKMDVWGSHGDRQPLFDVAEARVRSRRRAQRGRGPL